MIFLRTIKILFVLTAFCTQTSFAKSIFKDVEYTFDGKTFLGFLASPENLKTNTPLIVMVHNWKGVTDETKKQADRYVALGYQVFAADIFGKGVRPKDPKEAGAQATLYKSDRPLFRKHLNYALTTALSQSFVDKNKVAVMGYCFGGTGALELARSGAPLKSVISFHGGLDSLSPQDAKNIKASVLALHGADDPFVKAEDLAAFEKEMKDFKVKHKIIKYPGAVHSFTEVGAGHDNSKGAAYNKEADEKSFIEAEKELKAVFK